MTVKQLKLKQRQIQQKITTTQNRLAMYRNDLKTVQAELKGAAAPPVKRRRTTGQTERAGAVLSERQPAGVATAAVQMADLEAVGAEERLEGNNCPVE